MTEIRTLIADDHELFRMGVASLLNDLPDYSVVGECGTGEDTIAFLSQQTVDLLILDYAMPDGNGIDVIRRIASESLANLSIILLTGVDSALVFDEAIDAGVSAVVAKRGRGEELIAAIEAIRERQTFISPSVATILEESQILRSLTRRETEVLVILLEGRDTKGVAEQLSISFKTAETHKTRLMQKLDVHSTQQLIALARTLGLLGTG